MINRLVLCFLIFLNSMVTFALYIILPDDTLFTIVQINGIKNQNEILDTIVFRKLDFLNYRISKERRGLKELRKAKQANELTELFCELTDILIKDEQDLNRILLLYHLRLQTKQLNHSFIQRIFSNCAFDSIIFKDRPYILF